jgi:hypothetical protein
VIFHALSGDSITGILKRRPEVIARYLSGWIRIYGIIIRTEESKEAGFDANND